MRSDLTHVSKALMKRTRPACMSTFTEACAYPITTGKQYGTVLQAWGASLFLVFSMPTASRYSIRPVDLVRTMPHNLSVDQRFLGRFGPGEFPILLCDPLLRPSSPSQSPTCDARKFDAPVREHLLLVCLFPSAPGKA